MLCTEFCILGPGGKAADYPRNLVPGQRGEVTVGVVNHEYDVSFAVYQPQPNLEVRFLLFRQGDVNPYRSLHLWVDVGPGGAKPAGGPPAVYK